MPIVTEQVMLDLEPMNVEQQLLLNYCSPEKREDHVHDNCIRKGRRRVIFVCFSRPLMLPICQITVINVRVAGTKNLISWELNVRLQSRVHGDALPMALIQHRSIGIGVRLFAHALPSFLCAMFAQQQTKALATNISGAIIKY